MYLANPLALPINSNPGMVFPPKEFTATTDMARMAARVLHGILEHKSILDRRALPLERATSREKGQPLCMAQYYRLLTSCRIPGRPADVLFSSLVEGAIPEEEHVIVACRSQLYAVKVKANGRPLPEEEMAQQMMRVLQEAPSVSSPIATPPIGLLTAERRDTWADVRARLRRHETNLRSLEKIERSLMIICFDEPLPLDYNYSADGISLYRGKIGHFAGNRDETNMAHQMLHGGGSFYNSGNRWFDKTVQFVITSDGVCGLCYEHSPSEGIAVVQLMEKLLKNTADVPFNQPLATDVKLAHPPQRLQWIIEEDVRRSIKLAAQNIDRAIEDLDFYVFRFTDYGKEFIKSCRVSPDAYIQLALQLAYYRLHDCLTATYESASTRRFLLGRVDCIRSSTIEALEWVRAMRQAEDENEELDYTRRSDSTSDSYQGSDYLGGKRVTFNLSNEKRRIELMEAALRRQTEITIENILGEGIDIHLLGLREAAKEAGETLPLLFRDDEAFRLANHFSLSTSQIPMTMDCFMGYGPVVPDGYGASYCPHPDSIVFCLSAFRAFEPTDTWKFSQSLTYSLKTMAHLMQRRAQTGGDRK
ncbi:choline O-acetyltransferase-like isoform X3 [Ischnura elegans]|nr:choline O-acetyltransferase-like isoform X3 [Ischnura elegans]